MLFDGLVVECTAPLIISVYRIPIKTLIEGWAEHQFIGDVPIAKILEAKALILRDMVKFVYEGL
ncbi:hypothetical protein NDN01_24925 [Sphingomonas sp. QA11]|uniref:hypothetical protein n=1 Tax=Sphingomonas sp. QA11 TaxID=2950605 RepID=UPI00234A38A6|nr:hypothetical protein [Sphingomonas sp. QA11]WCM27187.1 hypothetical protein NDN01_24925 [Sphingomonas sp. QA11]